MTTLNSTPNIENPDDFYSELLAAHEGLTDDESAALNARLILVLANQVGDFKILKEAISTASE